MTVAQPPHRSYVLSQPQNAKTRPHIGHDFDQPGCHALQAPANDGGAPSTSVKYSDLPCDTKCSERKPRHLLTQQELIRRMEISSDNSHRK